MNDDRDQQRRTLRRQRAALTPRFRQAAARLLTRRVQAMPVWRRARNVALYCAYGSEMDVWPLIRAAHSANKRVYLPRVRGDRLRFVPFARTTRLARKTLGILEPVSNAPPAWRIQLDLVIVPLVGFDDHGGRLGQGGGFYDKHFSRLRTANWRKPILLGVGFEVQQLAHIALQPWDVPLYAVATENTVYQT